MAPVDTRDCQYAFSLRTYGGTLMTILDDVDTIPAILDARAAYEHHMEVFNTATELHEELMGQSRVGVIESCEYTQTIAVTTFDTYKLAKQYVAANESDPDNISIFTIVGADIDE